MRKIYKLGICVALALSLTGCAGVGANNSNNDNVDEETVVNDAVDVAEDLEANNTIEDTGVKFFEFSSVDLAGNTVTNEIFAEKDLTVVNVWATFCGPCIGEMPELGEWAKELPDNVQIIGMVADVNGVMDAEHLDLAGKIIGETGADFTHIIAGTKEFEPFLMEVTGVPTTFFVNKEGNIFGEPIVGAYVDGYKEVVEYLEGVASYEDMIEKLSYE